MQRALLKCDSLVCFAILPMLYYCVHCICAHGPIWLIALIKYLSTIDPLYTDTRYNDNIWYNYNLTGMKLSLEVTVDHVCKNIALNASKTYVLDICQNRLTETILTNVQIYVLWGNKNKNKYFLHIILPIKDSLQQQIHFNGNIFGKKGCRCNEVHCEGMHTNWNRIYGK